MKPYWTNQALTYQMPPTSKPKLLDFLGPWTKEVGTRLVWWDMEACCAKMMLARLARGKATHIKEGEAALGEAAHGETSEAALGKVTRDEVGEAMLNKVARDEADEATSFKIHSRTSMWLRREGMICRMVTSFRVAGGFKNCCGDSNS